MKKITVLIDGRSLYSATRGLGWDVDYRKLLDFYHKEGRLLRVYYCTCVDESSDTVTIRPLLDWLEYNGYTVMTKPARSFVDVAGIGKSKNSMDVDIAVTAMSLIGKTDEIVLFIGDGNFRKLVEELKIHGVIVTVVSTAKTNPAIVADELRREADRFIELDDLKGTFSKEPVRK